MRRGHVVRWQGRTRVLPALVVETGNLLRLARYGIDGWFYATLVGGAALAILLILGAPLIAIRNSQKKQWWVSLFIGNRFEARRATINTDSLALSPRRRPNEILEIRFADVASVHYVRHDFFRSTSCWWVLKDGSSYLTGLTFPTPAFLKWMKEVGVHTVLDPDTFKVGRPIMPPDEPYVGYVERLQREHARRIADQ